MLHSPPLTPLLPKLSKTFPLSYQVIGLRPDYAHSGKACGRDMSLIQAEPQMKYWRCCGLQGSSDFLWEEVARDPGTKMHSLHPWPSDSLVKQHNHQDKSTGLGVRKPQTNFSTLRWLPLSQKTICLFPLTNKIGTAPVPEPQKVQAGMNLLFK
jgi:hypothetical protein